MYLFRQAYRLKYRRKAWGKLEGILIGNKSKREEREVNRAVEYEKKEMGSGKSCSVKTQSSVFERDVVGTRSTMSARVFWSPKRWAFCQRKVLGLLLYNREIDILW